MSGGSDFSAALDDLRARALLRTRRIVETACGPEVVVDGRPLLAFCSNDYLGLAADPQLVAAAKQGADIHGVGSGASHLISGHYAAHHRLEERLAAFVGMEAALFFSTGYMANIGAITALVQGMEGTEGTAAVFSDELNHASLIDGIRLSGAEKRIYPHLDLARLSELLAASPASRKLVVTDAVFSMDGDLAPLPELLALCERFDAYLLVDDAHGFGVLGGGDDRGQGSLAHYGIDPARHPRLVYVGTLGKAAGVAGAFVAASEEIITWLLQRARTYIYTTGTPPLLAHALLRSVELIEQGASRRAHLQDLIDRLRQGLRPGLRRWRLVDSTTPIQPLIIGENGEAMRIAQALLDAGLWVPAIRPPTVPAGSARLRITLSAAHTVAQVQTLIDVLLELERQA
ncbi:8-amino-7-oxononanoate synthase [Sterolibacterium denitrificans]|uniref:8-amino-7-oxononanoate synthase n=1 Tax=Sterolibacterium denitrificans TaxID=157592 RepID=A0A7Z7MVG7_9PROT|nr:8-amino-7-oxononanoate synthase [Sterolibacterium denitrificans]SMB27458.1 8-amino-7-oxononanoate synthase [Sterolibacterium denitrificans]